MKSSRHRVVPGGARRALPLVLSLLILLAAGALASGLLAGPLLQETSSQTSTSDTITNFSGTWVRDERESDDPEEKASESRSRSQPGGFSWNAGTPGGSIGRPRGRPGQGGGGPGGDRDPLASLTRGLDVLRIDQNAELVRIRDARRETRLVIADGSTLSDGLGGRTVARFDGTSLVVQTTSERSTRTDILTLEDAGRRLVVTTDIQGSPRLGSFEFRTVYDRVEGTGREPTDDPLLPPVGTVTSRTTDAFGSSSGEHSGEHSEEEGAASSSGPVRRQATMVSSDVESAGEASRTSSGSVIRILAPERSLQERLSGRVVFQTLTIDPAIAIVRFSVDGDERARKVLPPFEAKLALADPPREQNIKAAAFDERGRRLGEDEIVINRLDPPFRVRIAALDGETLTGPITVGTEVSVPRKARLERIDLFLGEEQVHSVTPQPDRVSALVSERYDVELTDLPQRTPQDYLRVVAVLEDGRELEDVELLQGADFSEELDVQLVQLQVLVTDRSGAPVSGLEPSDFRIVDGGSERDVHQLYPSRDVALVLGLAIDSSGSMMPIWRQTSAAADQFLEGTMGARDSAFLVDFDTRLRLLQPLTRDRRALSSALLRLQPEGGTALYDSILFSLLQYEGEPGRRALIVVTDGFDSGSRADPKRAIDFGKRLGVPVYVIALNNDSRTLGGPGRGGRGGATSLMTGQSAARNELRLITDPTGGRLFQVGSVEQIRLAFAQIQQELRNQYVLTYYTDRRDGGPSPKIDVAGRGLRVRSALPLDLAR